ncbi:hypothetical protein Btru_077833 [Bulinus truncatus]|nr:hypothetical protein Btru_077833 [Bulinus truncatus]
MSEDAAMEGSSLQNSQENIQDLRKALKQWESAFQLVHQRKPDKNDISNAPKDIKDKYHLYFKLKKETEAGNVLKIKSPTSVSGDVWGAELNKKTKHDNEDAKTKSDPDTSKTSLTKLGDKLSHSLLKSSICEKLKSKKDNFKKNVNIMAGQQSSSKTANDGEILERGENLTLEKTILLHDTARSDDDEDFSIKGDMFKEASKLFISGSSSTTQKFSITHRPRLSFITSGALKQIDVRPGNKAEVGSSESLNVSAGDVCSPESQFDAFDEKKLTIKTLSPGYSDKETSSSLAVSTYKKHNASSSSKFTTDEERRQGTVSLCTDSASESYTSQDKSLKDEPVHLPINKSPGSLHDKPLNLLPENIGRQPKVTAMKNARQMMVPAPSDLFSFMEVDTCVMEEKPPAAVQTKTTKIIIKRLSGKRKRTNSTSDNMTGNEKVALEGLPLRTKKKKVLNRHQELNTTSSDMPDKSLPDDSELAKESDGEEKEAPRKTQKRKRTAASLNDNFVCLNMKRKAYRRKGGGMTSAQLRKKQWKVKMAARSKSFGSNKCFKCGQEGHWANKCTGMAKSSLASHPEMSATNTVDESDFPSLREAAMMSRGIKG